MTRQRTWLTINFNTRQHQISYDTVLSTLDFSLFLSLVLPSFSSVSQSDRPTDECVSIGIGYRTTNVPFSLTTIILGDLSRSIFSHELLSSS